MPPKRKTHATQQQDETESKIKGVEVHENRHPAKRSHGGGGGGTEGGPPVTGEVPSLIEGQPVSSEFAVNNMLPLPVSDYTTYDGHGANSRYIPGGDRSGKSNERDLHGRRVSGAVSMDHNGPISSSDDPENKGVHRPDGKSSTRVETNESGRRSCKIMDGGPNAMTIKLIKPPYKIKFMAPSKMGLRMSKGSGDKRPTSYVRFEGGDVEEALRAVDRAVMAFYKDHLTTILRYFKLDGPTVKQKPIPIINAGWDALVRDSSNEKELKRELTLFPNPDYNKLQEIKNGKIYEATSFLPHYDRTANSEWAIQMQITSIVIEYNEARGWITLRPYLNTPILSWINVGQDTYVDPQEIERQKREREAAESSEMLKFVLSRK